MYHFMTSKRTKKDKRITKGDVLEYLEKQPETDKTFF